MIKLSTNGKIFLAFWIFGLVNNVIYVVNLSAAIDVVGVLIPKSTVLLADVVPSFLIKLTGPFFVHIIPYNIRISILVVLSFIGMMIVALSDSVSFKLFGIVIASLSSGLGELSFLQLTHFFGEISISGFSSGTGGAGLVGSFCYLLFSTWLKLSIRTSLLIFSIVPAFFWISFYYILPASTLGVKSANELQGYNKIDDEEQSSSILVSQEIEIPRERDIPKIDSISVTLNRLKPLVIPYMIPLFLVYISEYIINQGISPTILFPIEDMPFSKYRDAYVTYGTLYQRMLLCIFV